MVPQPSPVSYSAPASRDTSTEDALPLRQVAGYRARAVAQAVLVADSAEGGVRDAGDGVGEEELVGGGGWGC